ncbi:hypothetical protein ABW21_db0202984 [Orbilia brochopaga]|nr:hypothetical protein ABW21_db0202984 [Drechslerella brochopaga]
MRTRYLSSWLAAGYFVLSIHLCIFIVFTSKQSSIRSEATTLAYYQLPLSLIILFRRRRSCTSITKMKASTAVSVVLSTLAIRAAADQCAAKLTPSCAWLCRQGALAGNATVWQCSTSNTNANLCAVCSDYNGCPATYDSKCPYYCNYKTYVNGEPGFCANVNVSTQGSVCQKCPGGGSTSVGPSNTTTTTTPPPPVNTGAASTLQISSAAIGGLLVALFATF